MWWSERERVCVCVDVRNREVETRCDELISKQDENERRETDGERANARRNGEEKPVFCEASYEYMSACVLPKPRARGKDSKPG